MATFGILVGGGPAPGINGVIAAAVTAACRGGHRVLGILDGFERIMEGDKSAFVPLDEERVAGIALRGGSILHTARANPTRRAEHLEGCVAALAGAGVENLITIGGDDTATSAVRVAEAAQGRIRVVHVPKTIDNDLPLPPGIPTFGFETARENAAVVLERLLEDAHTTRRWFLVVMMGRTAGHLALGAGKTAGAPVTVIPEEFRERPIRLEQVVRVIEGAIVKRLARGRRDGVAVIAEGIVEHMGEDDPILADVPRDDHGHLRLSEVPIGRLLRRALSEALAARGVDVSVAVDKEVGYELRCASPTAFDRDYTADLGIGAVRALEDGHSSVLVTRQAGGLVPVPFASILDPATGRARVRDVDVASEAYRNALALQERVTPDDLAAPDTLAALARAAKLAPDAARERYAVL